MADVSEEELEQLRQRNEKLRSDIATAQSKEAENVAARQREYDATMLAAENARLENQLASARDAAKVTTSKEGAANILDAAKAQLVAAEARAGETVGPVDTNAENQPKNTTGATVAIEGGVVTTAPDGVTTVSKPDSTTTEKNGGN